MRREHDGERCAGRVLDRDRATVRDHDVVHDGEAETRAAVTVATARVVEAGEALEDPFAIGIGDPGAVVDDARA